MNAKLKPIHQAYERCKEARSHLVDLAVNNGRARCMECLEDKCGIVVERWLVGKTTLVLFSTPHWWNIFPAYEEDNTTTGTLAYVTKLAEAK